MALFRKQSPQDIPRRRQSDSVVPSARLSADELSKRYSFRRNSTLAGATLPGNNDLSPRVHVHHLTHARRKIVLLLLGVVLVSVILWILVTGLTGRVRTEVTGVSTSQATVATYDQAITTYLTNHPLERLRLMMSAPRLLAALQAKHPEIQAVRFRAGTKLGETAFTLTMRHPVVGWTIDGRQAYVDATGTAFTVNYYASPAVQIVDNSGIPTSGGQAVASNRFLSFVGRLVGAVKTAGYAPSEVIIPPSTSRQVELKLTNETPSVIVSTDRPVGEQVEDMSRALAWFRQRGEAPTYIDVRVENRAYYR